jgi:hypothetical protein
MRHHHNNGKHSHMAILRKLESLSQANERYYKISSTCKVLELRFDEKVSKYRVHIHNWDYEFVTNIEYV